MKIEKIYGLTPDIEAKDADAILLTTYQNLDDELHHEIIEASNRDEPPTCVICVTREFFEKYIEEDSEFSSIDEFLENYTYDNVEDLPWEAEKEHALLFTYCKELDMLYVPEWSGSEGVYAALAKLWIQDTACEEAERRLLSIYWDGRDDLRYSGCRVGMVPELDELFQRTYGMTITKALTTSSLLSIVKKYDEQNEDTDMRKDLKWRLAIIKALRKTNQQ